MLYPSTSAIIDALCHRYSSKIGARIDIDAMKPSLDHVDCQLTDDCHRSSPACTATWSFCRHGAKAAPRLYAGIILCFYAFDLPQFAGTRMAAATVILLMFGVASIPLTYLCSFLFTDEMKALQVHPGCRPGQRGCAPLAS